MRTYLISVLFVFFLTLAGCSTLFQTARPVSPEIQNVLGEIQSANASLYSSKGIGMLEVWANGNHDKYRMAWIGEMPRNMRISLLDISGRPFMTLSHDGENLYGVSHFKDEFHKVRDSNPTLNRLSDLPIHFQDILTLLMGRIPLKPFRSAELSPPDSQGGRTLTFTDGWGNVTQKLFLNPANEPVHSYEIHDDSGQYLYRVDRDHFRLQDNFSVPFTIAAMGTRSGFRLTIDQYWANATIKPGTFILTPQKR